MAFSPRIFRRALSLSFGRSTVCCTASGQALSPCGQSLAKSQMSSPSSSTQNSMDRSQLSMPWK